MKSVRYDLVVVGAGSGGYAAARTARELGASVALVDRGPLGGLCILRGCMPSKTLIASSDAAYAVGHARELGIDASLRGVDAPAIIARKDRIIQGFADDRIAGIRTFPLYDGQARFLSGRELAVGDDVVLEADRFVIATGSIVAPPAIPGLAEAGYVDSDAALSLATLPASLVVLGGGYVACELGQYFSRLGVPTTMVLRAPHVLSCEDDDVGDALTAALRDENIRVETNALPIAVESSDARKRVRFTRSDATGKCEEGEVEAAEILYALGRVPDIAGLELEHAGVEYHPITGIAVDDTLRTSNPAIFAVGDVTGTFPLVHVAIYQGEVAARNAVRRTDEHANYTLVRTHAVFTDPQVAVVGANEKELQKAETPYLAASYPFNDHGKSIALGKTKGFVKMLAAPHDGRILGAAVVGPEGSDLIHEAIVAMSYDATVYEFVKIPHLHPTLAEIWTYPAEELVARLAAPQAQAAAS